MAGEGAVKINKIEEVIIARGPNRRYGVIPYLHSFEKSNPKNSFNFQSCDSEGCLQDARQLLGNFFNFGQLLPF